MSLKVFLPAGVRDIKEKQRWFEDPTCRKLAAKGVEFGFELKGKSESLQGMRDIIANYPCGYHTVPSFADDMFDRDVRNLASDIRGCNLLYVVMHGRRIGEQNPEYLEGRGVRERYASNIDAWELYDAVEGMAWDLNVMQREGIPAALENTGFTNFDLKDGIFLPATYLDPRVGNWSFDMSMVRHQSEAMLVCDIQHLAFSLNFAHRCHNYSFLPTETYPHVENLSCEARQLWGENGLLLNKGKIPVAVAGALQEEMARIGARIYHLSGYYNGEQMEVCGGKVVSHYPLKNDRSTRDLISQLLDLEAKILVVEVAGSTDNPCWDYLPPTEITQRASLHALCEVLLSQL